MTPEEIVTDINAKSVELLAALTGAYTADQIGQITELLTMAGMNGFRLGSNTALSMVQGSLVVALERVKK